jgi:hypothetical protein
MNITLVKASVEAGTSLLEISNKLLSPTDTLIDLANLIKCYPERVNEFIATFMHRKKVPAKVRWESLIVLNCKQNAFSLINIDKDGSFIYQDEAFLSYVIERYVALTGIPATHAAISNALANKMINNRFNSYVQSIHVMAKFVKSYEVYLYSEFANDFYTAEVLLEAINIVSEANAAS